MDEFELPSYASLHRFGLFQTLLNLCQDGGDRGCQRYQLQLPISAYGAFN